MLVVIQFALSIGLIISMSIVSKQVGFMRNAEIGFEKENVLILPISGNVENIIEELKNELKQRPDIVHVSLKSSSPLRSGPTSGECLLQRIHGFACIFHRRGARYFLMGWSSIIISDP